MKRAKSVIVKAQDEKGKAFEFKTDGLLAVVIQHEYDHIEGTVFTDRADPKSYMSLDEYVSSKK